MVGFSRLHEAKIIVFVVLFFLLGCGYHFSLNEVKKEPKGVKVRKIHIDPFINRTPQRKLENFLINELVYEFNTGDELEIVERERAEAILTGEFIAYEATGIAYTRGEYTATGRVRIAIKAKLIDRNQNIVWEKVELSDQEEFQVTTNPSQTRDNREKAVHRIIKRLAERIYEELRVGL